LAEQGKIDSELSNEQMSLLDTLQPLNIEARYPLYKEQLSKTLDQKTCEDIIDRTEELLTWIKDKQ
jgi:hypothetical protein